MKRKLKLLAGLVLVLALVLFVRTFRFRSNQVRLEPVAAPAVHGERAVAHLSEAIRFKTVSHENRAEDDSAELMKLHEFFSRAYPRLHGVVSRETVNEASLLYPWKGARSDLSPVLFMAHQDVVPVEPGTKGNWTHPPFEGKVIPFSEVSVAPRPILHRALAQRRRG